MSAFNTNDSPGPSPASYYDFFSDAHQPTTFSNTAEEWNTLRDYLWNFGLPYKQTWKGDGSGINPEKRVYAYRIAIGMNRMQDNYEAQMSVVGQQGRNLAERVCCLLEPVGGYPKVEKYGKKFDADLNMMINAQDDQTLKGHLHELRILGNNADHENTKDFVPKDKATCVDAAFLCARIVREHLDTKYPDDATRTAARAQQATRGDRQEILLYLQDVPECIAPLLNAGFIHLDNLKDLRDGLLSDDEESIEAIKELGLGYGFRSNLKKKLKCTTDEEFDSLRSKVLVRRQLPFILQKTTHTYS